MKKVLIILGPTATGKTDLALFLAKKYNGELVACDSRQVFKGLDIGTGKLPGGEVNYRGFDKYWMINGVKVWMYDVVPPTQPYDVAQYYQDAKKIIIAIIKKGKLPIIVGGSGLYLKVLTDGLSNSSGLISRHLRDRLERFTVTELQDYLKQLSINRWSSLNSSDKANKRRLIRQIEVLVGDEINNNLKKEQQIKPFLRKYNLLKIGLSTNKNILDERINNRVVKRVDQGMIDEGKRLVDEGLKLERMRELGLEYRIIADYLEEKIKTEEEFINILSLRIRQYAKRQLTWFKKDSQILWFDINVDLYNKVEKKFKEWYI